MRLFYSNAAISAQKLRNIRQPYYESVEIAALLRIYRRSYRGLPSSTRKLQGRWTLVLLKAFPDSCQRSVSTNHYKRSLPQLHLPRSRHQRPLLPTMAEAHHPLAPSLPLPRSMSSSIIFGKRRSAMNDFIAFHTRPRRAPSIPL